MSAPKVAVCIPFYRHIEGETTMALMGIMGYSANHLAIMPIYTSGAYIEDNRNGCVRFALDTGVDFDWLMWIDGDMVFPNDTLMRLISHNKDICGANYRARTPPYPFVGHYIDGSDTKLLDPGLHPMEHLPTGMLLTRFDIYRKMEYPWFKPGLVTDPRDDIYFCREARKLGYEIWCDHDLTFEVAHYGGQMIPWFNRDQLVPVEGAELSIERGRQEAKARAEASAGQLAAE